MKTLKNILWPVFGFVVPGIVLVLTGNKERIGLYFGVVMVANLVGWAEAFFEGRDNLASLHHKHTVEKAGFLYAIRGRRVDAEGLNPPMPRYL